MKGWGVRAGQIPRSRIPEEHNGVLVSVCW